MEKSPKQAASDAAQPEAHPGMPSVLLRPDETDRVIAGHRWIYKGSIDRLTKPAADGEIVQVKDHRQRFLGVGIFNSRSKINVRVLETERVSIDQR